MNTQWRSAVCAWCREQGLFQPVKLQLLALSITLLCYNHIGFQSWEQSHQKRSASGSQILKLTFSVPGKDLSEEERGTQVCNYDVPYVSWHRNTATRASRTTRSTLMLSELRLKIQLRARSQVGELRSVPRRLDSYNIIAISLGPHLLRPATY